MMFKIQIWAIGELITYEMSLLLDFYRIYKITQNMQNYTQISEYFWLLSHSHSAHSIVLLYT